MPATSTLWLEGRFIQEINNLFSLPNSRSAEVLPPEYH